VAAELVLCLEESRTLLACQFGRDRDTGDPPSDHGLREAVFLAAEHACKVDPTLAARYHRLIVEGGKHNNSAVCTIAGVLVTRLAACWRNGQTYVIRDLDGNEITPEEGHAICAERFKIPPAIRAARRSTTTAKKLKTKDGLAQSGVDRSRSGVRPVRRRRNRSKDRVIQSIRPLTSVRNSTPTASSWTTACIRATREVGRSSRRQSNASHVAPPRHPAL
jgi:hypothetical protein